MAKSQIVLSSTQHMDVPAIAKIAFTSEDRVREFIHNFNADGFDLLAPKYAAGRRPRLVRCWREGGRAGSAPCRHWEPRLFLIRVYPNEEQTDSNRGSRPRCGPGMLVLSTRE